MVQAFDLLQIFHSEIELHYQTEAGDERSGPWPFPDLIETPADELESDNWTDHHLIADETDSQNFLLNEFERKGEDDKQMEMLE